MRKNIISGVYSITNIVNGMVYIGSSCNILNRWSSHKCMLRKNYHHEKDLQNDWNTYGEDCFTFDFVETDIQKDELLIKEKYYIKKFISNGIELYNNVYPISDNPVIRKKEFIENTSKNILRGEDIWSNKYSEEQILALIDDLKLATMTYDELSKKHGIGKDTIKDVRLHKSWKHLTHGIIFPPIPQVKHKCSKLSEEDVKNIIQLFIEGKSNAQISRMFNVSENAIKSIRNHESWKELTECIIFPVSNGRYTSKKI